MSIVIPRVIAYHKISTQKDIGINQVDPKKFENQVNILLDLGYNPVTFLQLADAKQLPDKPIVITFDDGYDSVYTHAFPILKKYNIPAVVFVITNYLGDINNWESFPIQRYFRHLTADEIIELHNSGWEIGSHSKNHPYLPTLSDSKLADEIKGSKETIENIIHDRVISFCYPYGRYNTRSLQIVKNSGYIYATCNMRLFRTPLNQWSIKRRSIYSTDSISSFIEKLDHSQNQPSLSILKEWIIQKGAIPGITVNVARNLKY